jgi:hypothetical protein
MKLMHDVCIYIHTHLVGTFNTFSFTRLFSLFLELSSILALVSSIGATSSSFGGMYKYISAWLHSSSVKVAIVFVPVAIMSAIKLSRLSSIWNKQEFSMNFYNKQEYSMNLCNFQQFLKLSRINKYLLKISLLNKNFLWSSRISN